MITTTLSHTVLAKVEEECLSKQVKDLLETWVSVGVISDTKDCYMKKIAICSDSH